VSELHKRSVVVSDHATSVSLEKEFWAELNAAARRRNVSLNALVSMIDKGRNGNLSSALRLFVLAEIRAEVRAEIRSGNTPQTRP